MPLSGSGSLARASVFVVVALLGEHGRGEK
jgi:hypothetical protein